MPRSGEKSPFRYLVESNANSMRRHLDGGYQAGEFELLDRLKAEGGTDYFAMVTVRPIGGELSDRPFRLLLDIDRPGGYSEADLVALEARRLGLRARLHARRARCTGRSGL